MGDEQTMAFQEILGIPGSVEIREIHGMCGWGLGVWNEQRDILQYQ